MPGALESTIFSIKSQEEFEQLSLKVFAYQYQNNSVYKTFCDHLGRNPMNINKVNQIPFLPISFFKTKKVVAKATLPKMTFTSSGTTGQQTSNHFVADLGLYRESFLNAFTRFYGNPEEYCILALLPSYLERKGSSLIYMVDALIQLSKHSESGYFLYDFENLKQQLAQLESINQKTLLIGVSFALLDFAENHPIALKNTIVMETGGMKGRKKEMTREELHSLLKDAFNLSSIHSEYGMTELLSQAYSKGDGIFQTPTWMKVLTRDTEDPLSFQQLGKTGGINVIDLANLHSCSFIATQDLGRTFENGMFEILGRFDHSDIRGCNLMAL